MNIQYDLSESAQMKHPLTEMQAILSKKLKNVLTLFTPMTKCHTADWLTKLTKATNISRTPADSLKITFINLLELYRLLLW